MYRRCPECHAIGISVPNVGKDIWACLRCEYKLVVNAQQPMSRRILALYCAMAEVPWSVEDRAAELVADHADARLWDDIRVQIDSARNCDGGSFRPAAMFWYPVLIYARSPHATGALLSALDRSLMGHDWQKRLLEKLASVLPQLTKDQSLNLGQAALESLKRLLPEPGLEVSDDRWAMVPPVSAILGWAGYWQALRTLRRIVRGKAWDSPPPREAREAARSACRMIFTKVELMSDRRLLLRACDPGKSDPARLLRRASAGVEPMRQLLHAGTASQEPI